jgi:hypothetical protein
MIVFYDFIKIAKDARRRPFKPFADFISVVSQFFNRVQ